MKRSTKKNDSSKSERSDMTEFARFDELTRRLMSVPKKEIDEKAAEYKAKKSKKPTGRHTSNFKK